MNKCRVCGHESSSQGIIAKEMMFENAGQFEYFECPNCKCLQIAQIPNNITHYYGPDYYSFQEPADTKTKGEKQNPLRVLDVGCGAGLQLCAMAANGITAPTGCDPFIEKDIEYENGVKIFKKSIHEMDGEFDIIMLSDSFEHMSDPHEVFESLKRLLAPKGAVRMTLPVYPNFAFDIYRENWYQLDAPRHIILHSPRSLELLAKQHGLKLANFICDSNNSAILRSYLYKKGITFYKQKPEEIGKYFTKSELVDIERKTADANKKAHGDHATVVFVHA